MKTKNRNYVIVTAVFVLLTSGICFAGDDNDFQYWSAAGFSFDLDKDWKAVVTQELRIGESAGNLYYEHTEMGLIYSGLARCGFRLQADFRDRQRRRMEG